MLPLGRLANLRKRLEQFGEIFFLDPGPSVAYHEFDPILGLQESHVDAAVGRRKLGRVIQ